MAITYPLDFPTVTGVASIGLREMETVALSRSPFTQSQQTFRHGSGWWEADIKVPPMLRAEAAEWIAFLTSLKGSTGTFLMGIPDATTPRGAIGGTPVVSGAGQTGSSLDISGATGGVTDWLMANDLIQLGSGSSATLHKVLADVNTSSGGTATLDVWPDIRTAPSNGATVTVTSCKGLWRRASNVQPWSIDVNGHYHVSFTVIEAVS
jgi:hypothetical protein